jgi:hypothetical protein
MCSMLFLLNKDKLCMLLYFHLLYTPFIVNRIGDVVVSVLTSSAVDRGFEPDDDEVRFTLDQHSELYFHSASSLKQQSAGRYVVPLGHIILFPRLLTYVNLYEFSHKLQYIFY